MAFNPFGMELIGTGSAGSGVESGRANDFQWVTPHKSDTIHSARLTGPPSSHTLNLHLNPHPRRDHHVHQGIEAEQADLATQQV